MSNLLRHLKTKHLTVPLTKPLRNQNNLSSNNEEYIDDPSSIPSVATTSTSENTASSTVLPETVSLSTSNQSRQSTITQFVSKPILLSKSKAIDLQISKFIIKHFHPFSLVEEIDKMLAPNYIIPSRKTISNSLLLQLYESVLEKVKIDLQSVKALSLTTDGWTSINNQHYIALTVHFINSETKLCSRLIGCTNFNEKCTSQELSDFLKTTVKKWNIENKISAVVTNNAPNIVLS